MTGLHHERVAANHPEQVLGMVKVAMHCDQVGDRLGRSQLFPKWKQFNLKAIAKGETKPVPRLGGISRNHFSRLAKMAVHTGVAATTYVRYEPCVMDHEVIKRYLITATEMLAPLAETAGKGERR